MTTDHRTVRVRLFGAFRQHAATATLDFDLPDTARVSDLRAAMGTRIDDTARALLQASAFADDERVLLDSEPLPAANELAILPPVSGG